MNGGSDLGVLWLGEDADEVQHVEAEGMVATASSCASRSFGGRRPEVEATAVGVQSTTDSRIGCVKIRSEGLGRCAREREFERNQKEAEEIGRAHV